jgi:hypothetical protein
LCCGFVVSSILLGEVRQKLAACHQFASGRVPAACVFGVLTSLGCQLSTAQWKAVVAQVFMERNVATPVLQQVSTMCAAQRFF